jgi:hypothetical protein
MVRSFWRYWGGGFVEVSPGLDFRAAINRQNHIKVVQILLRALPLYC